MPTLHDTQDGQTHSYGDGCKEEHGQMPPQESKSEKGMKNEIKIIIGDIIHVITECQYRSIDDIMDQIKKMIPIMMEEASNIQSVEKSNMPTLHDSSEREIHFLGDGCKEEHGRQEKSEGWEERLLKIAFEEGSMTAPAVRKYLFPFIYQLILSTSDEAIEAFCVIVKNELRQQRFDGFSLDGTDFDAIFNSVRAEMKHRSE